MEKLEIEKTKPTFIPVLKVKHEVVLVSSNYFNETSLANKWISFSSSNLALVVNSLQCTYVLYVARTTDTK